MASALAPPLLPLLLLPLFCSLMVITVVLIGSLGVSVWWYTQSCSNNSGQSTASNRESAEGLGEASHCCCCPVVLAASAVVVYLLLLLFLLVLMVQGAGVQSHQKTLLQINS